MTEKYALPENTPLPPAATLRAVNVEKQNAVSSLTLLVIFSQTDACGCWHVASPPSVGSVGGVSRTTAAVHALPLGIGVARRPVPLLCVCEGHVVVQQSDPSIGSVRYNNQVSVRSGRESPQLFN